MQSAYFGSISTTSALRFRRSQAMIVEPEPANKSATRSPALVLFTSDQLYRFRRRVYPIGGGFALMTKR